MGTYTSNPASTLPWFLVILCFSLVAFNSDSQRTQKINILHGEGCAARLAFRALAGLLLHFVQAYGRLEHEQHVEAVLADVLNDAGDLLGLGDALMDRLAQLLDQLTQLLIQSVASVPAGTTPLADADFPLTLPVMSLTGNLNPVTLHLGVPGFSRCCILRAIVGWYFLTMRPKTLGRALGIGVRIAGKALIEEKPLPPAAREARAAAAQAAAQARAEAVRAAGVRARSAGTALGDGTRRIGHGTRNFGRAVWNPFATATGVLWLEITGLFFALFALFFAQHLYELRAAWRSGPEHLHFLLYAVLCALFAYFSASSFLRAGRKQNG